MITLIEACDSVNDLNQPYSFFKNEKIKSRTIILRRRKKELLILQPKIKAKRRHCKINSLIRRHSNVAQRQIGNVVGPVPVARECVSLAIIKAQFVGKGLVEIPVGDDYAEAIRRCNMGVSRSSPTRHGRVGRLEGHDALIQASFIFLHTIAHAVPGHVLYKA